MYKIYEVYEVEVTKTTYIVKQPKVKKTWFNKPVKSDYFDFYYKPKTGYTLYVSI